MLVAAIKYFQYIPGAAHLAPQVVEWFRWIKQDHSFNSLQMLQAPLVLPFPSLGVPGAFEGGGTGGATEYLATIIFRQTVWLHPVPSETAAAIFVSLACSSFLAGPLLLSTTGALSAVGVVLCHCLAPFLGLEPLD